MTVRLYVGSPLSDCPPLRCGRTAPVVSEEEGSNASRFYRWFLESYNSCLLLQGPSLKVPAMIVYDVATKVLGTE